MRNAMQGLPISIIIPTFNREGSIARAITSVQGQVAGSYEVIVVDDGSSDSTADRAQRAIADSHGVSGRVLQQVNGGPGAARNSGSEEARGRYLAFLDSDDFWYPHTLAYCLEALEEKPALVFLQTIDIVDGGAIEKKDYEGPVLQRFDGFLEAVTEYPSTRYGSCNVVLRHDIYEALGGFSCAIRCSEDTDLFLRAADRGPCYVLSGTPLVAHVTGSNDRLTGRFSAVLEGYEFMLNQERHGRYPDSTNAPGLRDQVLAQCAAHTVLAAFATGHIGTAFTLYLQSMPRLLRAKNWHWLIRLPLVPLLVFIRPSSYRIRWTATDQRAREI